MVQEANRRPLIINARADTIATKPAFRDAVCKRRCIIPASGFYEWSAGADGARLLWLIARSDGAVMAFAAIWQMWEEDGQSRASCAMVTTEAGHGAAPLMVARGRGVLTARRVSPVVNSNRAQGHALIEPYGA